MKKVLVMMLLIVLLLMNLVHGGSIFTDDDFKDGKFKNVELTDDGIVLKYGDEYGNNWTNVYPNTSTGKRCYYAMTYSDNHDVVVIFGGVKGSSLSNETWIYNVKNNVWKRMNPNTKPSPRWGACMAYDSKRHQIYLFGGEGLTNSVFNDLWVYNITTNTWREITTTMKPSKRNLADMVYDPINDRIILFGGRYSIYGWTIYYNDTWIFNIGDNRWYNITSISSQRPNRRCAHQLTYIQSKKEVMLYGGYTTTTALSDVWLFKCSTNKWMKIGNAPVARCYHGMSYEKHTGKVVVFGGGVSSNNVTNDTWEFSPSTRKWMKRDITHSPPARSRHSMVYISSKKTLMVYGGYGGSELMKFNDTWMYGLKVHASNGEYTSKIIDLGGKAHFGKLHWNCDLPTKTSIKFQMRSSDSSENISDEDFVGPDGRTDTYYVSNDTKIFNGHNGDRVIQYKAYFSTDKLTVSPTLSSIRIEYNLMQYVRIIHPTGGEKLNGTVNIKWEAEDKDNDSLYYDIYLLDENNSTYALSKNISTKNLYWDTNEFKDGKYRIKIVCKDDNKTIPIVVEAVSNWFTVENALQNNPPISKLLHPQNNEIIFNESIILRWEGTDADGDALKYYVFFSNRKEYVENRTFIYSLTSENETVVENLKNNETYYWTVIPNDSKENGTCEQGIWKFRVNIKKNSIPSVKLLSPENNSKVRNPVKFKWMGYDKDGNHLSYIFYISKTLDDIFSNPINMSMNEHILDLKYGIYYWTVIPWDGRSKGNCTSGIWTFEVVPNRKPITYLIKPENNSEIYGKEVYFEWKGYDDDNDTLVYYLIIGRSMDEVLNPVNVIKTNNTSYVMNLNDGEFYWSVVPYDGIENGTCEEGIWSFKLITGVNLPPTSVLISPKNRSITSTCVTLLWEGEDSEGDEITYNVIMSKNLKDVMDKKNVIVKTKDNKFTFSNLEYGVRYYWTVIPYDSFGNEGICKSGIWSFETKASPIEKLQCSILSPKDGDVITGKIKVRGVAHGNVIRVELRIDDGEYMIAIGNTTWELEIDTTKIENGEHTIYARAVGRNSTATSSIKVIVDNKKGGGITTLMGASISAIIILILSSVVVLYIMTRRRKSIIFQETDKKVERLESKSAKKVEDYEEDIVSTEKISYSEYESLDEGQPHEEFEEEMDEGLEEKEMKEETEEEEHGEDESRVEEKVEEKKENDEEFVEDEKLDDLDKIVNEIVGKKEKNAEEKLDEILKKIKS